MSTVEVLVAVVGRAHGVRGDLNLNIHTDEPERRFAPGAVVRTRAGRRLEVSSARGAGGRFLVHFRGVDDRNAAEELTGEQLFADVPVDETPSGDEEFYDRQLVGLTVLRADGTQGGVITDVLHPGVQDLLVVDVDGQERLIPFVSALVPVVDVAAGHVQLADVQGLLEEPEE